jgi:hypothetical protein
MPKSKSAVDVNDLLSDEEKQEILSTKIGVKFTELFDAAVEEGKTLFEFIEKIQADPYWDHMADLPLVDVLTTPVEETETRTRRPPVSEEIVAAVKDFIKANRDCNVLGIKAGLTTLDPDEVHRAVKKLAKDGAVVLSGEKRNTTYSIAKKAA